MAVREKVKGHVQKPLVLAVSDELKGAVQNRLGRPQRERGLSMSPREEQ